MKGDAVDDPRSRRPLGENTAVRLGGSPFAVPRDVEDATGAVHRNLSVPPPRVLFVALSDDMGSERIIPGMAEVGFECGLLCPGKFASAKLRSVSRHFPLPALAGFWSSAPFVPRALARIIRDWRPDMILPLDDLSAWLLRGLSEGKRSGRAMRTVLGSSLGHPRGYAASVDRRAFMDLAQSLGIPKPDHCDGGDIERSIFAARRWGFPLVVKSDLTCGGVGVRMVDNEAELLEVLSTIAHPSWSRRLVASAKQQVCDLSGLNVELLSGVVVQPFLAGTLAFHTAFAWRGQVLEGVSFIAQETHPTPVGSATVVRPIDDPAMARSVEAIAKALSYSGFLSVDFIVEEGSGEAKAIELNARSIGSTHLGRLFGHDICSRAMVALRRSPTMTQSSVGAYSAVALFPKEMMRAPGSPRLSTPGIYHDVPWSEPRLVASYLKRAARLV